MKTYEFMFVCTVALVAATIAAKVKPYMCSQPHSADGYVEPIVWRCHGQLPLWSYNLQRNECLEFRYGGCGGNDNSFYTKKDCEETCQG